MFKFFKLLVLTLFLTAVSNVYAASNQGNNLNEIYKQLGLDEKISYSADIEMTSSASQTMPMNLSKMYYQNGNIRTEGDASGMKFITILRKEGTMYSYNGQMDSWMTTDMNAMLNQEQNMPTYTKMGKETVDDKNCIKYKTEDPSIQMEGYIWVNDGIIYKNEFTSPYGTNTVYYKNIKKEKIDSSLFMPPKDANVQDMTALLQGMMQQQQQ